MTDKPQTLAEQALKLAGLQERMDAIGNQKQNHKPIIDCLRDCAAALADAAATTTPAQRAGDVGQAVPEWGTSDKAQHYAAMVTDTNDADILRAAISDLCRDNERLAVMLKSAKQPDPTPALGWNAMQTFACEVISAYDEDDQQLCCDGRECGCQGATVHQAMRHYIKADPGPTDAQLLAEALKLPDVQAMRTALQTLRNLMCEAFEDDDGNSGCGLCENDCTGCIAHFALAKIGEAK